MTDSGDPSPREEHLPYMSEVIDSTTSVQGGLPWGVTLVRIVQLCQHLFHATGRTHVSRTRSARTSEYL